MYYTKYNLCMHLYDTKYNCFLLTLIAGVYLQSNPFPVSICSKLGKYSFKISTIAALVTSLDLNKV